MTIGAVLPGQGTILAVGATSALGMEVGGNRSWSAPQAKNKSERKYYGNTPTKVIYGKSVDTWQVQVDLTSGDDGQRFIRARFKDGTSFFIGYVDEAGNGEYQEVTSGGLSPQGQNPDDPNTDTFEFGGIADRVDIGAGPG